MLRQSPEAESSGSGQEEAAKSRAQDGEDLRMCCCLRHFTPRQCPACGKPRPKPKPRSTQVAAPRRQPQFAEFALCFPSLQDCEPRDDGHQDGLGHVRELAVILMHLALQRRLEELEVMSTSSAKHQVWDSTQGESPSRGSCLKPKP